MKNFLKLIFFLNILFCGFSPKLVSAQQDSSRPELKVFPNPFKTSTFFNFTLFKSDSVTLTVYNRWGEIMAMLLNNEWKQAGSYSYLFNGDTLPDGIYLYNLVTKVSGHAMGSIAKMDSVADFGLQIYPNPFSDFTNFFITNTKTDTVSIDVYDLTGRVVKSLLSDSIMAPGNHRLIFNADTLKAGIYFAKFKVNDSTINRQIIKVNKTTSLAASNYKPTPLKVSPNPFQDNITISGLEPVSGRLEIINSLGQSVKIQYLQSQADVNIQLNEVPAGAYFIKVKYDDKPEPLMKLLVKEKF